VALGSRESDADARVGSARFKAALAPLTVSGEFAYEGGSVRGVPLRARPGTPTCAGTCRPRVRPTSRLLRVLLGDREDTEANEEFFPWTFHWSDWSKYYAGDYVSSMLLNADSRIWRLEGGVQATEQVSLRAPDPPLLARHRQLRVLPAGGRGPPLRRRGGRGRGFHPQRHLELLGHGLVGRAGKVAEYAWGDREAWQLFLSATYSFSVDAMAGR